LGLTILAGSLLTTSPSFAEPDIDDVQVRVDHLYHEAEQASERFNHIREDMKTAQARLTSLQADVARQQARVDGVRDQVVATIVSQYQGQGLSSTTQVFLSEDPEAFLSQLATVSEYNDQQGAIMAAFATQAKQLEMREQAANRQLAEIERAQHKLAAEKAEIDAKAAEANDLLTELEAEERARLANAPSRGGSRVPPVKRRCFRARKRGRRLRSGPGRRLLRVRRRRSGRVRLLRTYDDGVGAGGCESSALGREPDGIGSVGVAVGPSAG